MSYQDARNTRRESRSIIGRFRSAKLAPVMCVPVLGNEGGVISQSITMELDPIAGRLVTPITGDLVAVFVPVQAMDALLHPESDYAGITDVVREKLLTGNPLFSTEVENVITKRCGVVPASYAGVKKVSQAVGLAHNCAVNLLRQRRYDKAPLLTAGQRVMTNAIVAQTALDKLNGVLDPDDRVNGAVKLTIPTMALPVTGILRETTAVPGGAGVSGKDSTGSAVTYATAAPANSTTAGNRTWVDVDSALATAKPKIFAQLNGASAGNVSLTDFYRAEKMDGLTRTMRQILDENPEYGEEMVLRWAFGMSVDAGRTPWVVAERSQIFGRSMVGATDSAGIAAETMRSDLAMTLNFMIPIPKTELGGIIVTFATVRPDETLASQPHPFLSDAWAAENFTAAEMALDPVPVNLRRLHSEVPAANESDRAMYIGYNGLMRLYVNYGLSRQLNPATIANKTAVWQLELSPSVSPDTILYPDDFPQYPFADQNAEICTYVVSSQAVIKTPLIFGPTPVETLATIATNDLFDQV